MSPSHFSGIRIISAALAAVFFFTQGGFAETVSLPQTAAVKTHIDILQDVHCNSQTQESIYKYLENLHAQNKLSGILQEGASGNIDRSVWSKLDSAKRSKVMQGLYRDGWMGGAEKFAVEHPEVSYSGVELKALYDIHRDVYRDVISKQEEARESLHELGVILSELQSKFYSTKLIRLEQEWQIARRDGNSLYLFIKKHLKNIPENKLTTFSSDFRSLIEAIKNEKKPSKLTVEDFGSGMEKFHGMLREPLIQSDDTARLLKLIDYYDLLKELWSLELTPQSYEKFLSLEKSISLKVELAYLTSLINKQAAAVIFAQDNRNAAKAYYEVAKRRDAAIYKNVVRTLKNKSGHFVLVAGGFHGQDLADRFKQSRISYSLVKPNFSEIDSNLQDKYTRAMGIASSKADLKVYVQNLMTLIPEPVTIRPEFVQAFEPVFGSSLGSGDNSLKSSGAKKMVFATLLSALVLGLPSEVLGQENSASEKISNNVGAYVWLSASLIISMLSLVGLGVRWVVAQKSIELSKKWMPKTLSLTKDVEFNSQEALKIVTEKGSTLAVENGTVTAGENTDFELKEGVNYFLRSVTPQVFSVSQSIPSIKIQKGDDGALQVGKLLASGTGNSFSIRFLEGVKVAKKAAGKLVATNLGEVSSLTHEEVFFTEKGFPKWADDEVSAAYIEAGNNLVVVVEKSGAIKLSRIINDELLDPENDLEEIQNFTANLENAPVVVAVEKIKFHKLTEDVSEYSAPFVITRNGSAFSLRLLEPVEKWTAELFTVNSIGPIPFANQKVWGLGVIASFLMLLSSPIPLLMFGDKKISSGTSATPVIPIAPPAPIVSTSAPAPLPPAPVPTPPAPTPTPRVPDPAPPAPTPTPRVPDPVPPAPPVPSAAERMGLPLQFAKNLEEVKRYIASPLEGVAVISTDNSRVTISPVLPDRKTLEQKRLELQSRFDWLIANIPILDARYGAELRTSRSVTPDVDMSISSEEVERFKDELTQLLPELNRVDRELLQGTMGVLGGTVLVRNGDTVQAGQRIIELPADNGRRQIQNVLPAQKALPILLGFIRPKFNGNSPENLMVYSEAAPGDNRLVVFEFDALPGLNPGDSVLVEFELTEEGRRVGSRQDWSEHRPVIRSITAQRSGWFQLDEAALRSGNVTNGSAIGSFINFSPSIERHFVSRQLAVLRLIAESFRIKLERNSSTPETLRAEIASLDARIAALNEQLTTTPRDRETRDKNLADTILTDLARISGEAQSAPDAASSSQTLTEIRTRLSALTYSGTRFKALAENVLSSLTALIDRIGNADRNKSEDAVQITDLIGKTTEARRFDPVTVPDVPQTQIRIWTAELQAARLSKRQRETRLRDLLRAPETQREAREGIATLEARLRELEAARPTDRDPVLASQSGSLILPADRRGIVWVQNGGEILQVIEARSLGEKTRREVLMLGLKSAAAAAVAGLTGCLSQSTIDNTLTDRTLSVTDSLITPASEVRIKEVVLKLAKITEILKHPTGTPVEKDLALYIPERSYSMRNANFQRESAAGARDFLSGLTITPQFSVSTDFAGGVGIQGGFNIQIPTALGGGTLYLPIGINSLEEDIKATLSFVSMTHNLIIGAGNYFSDMSNIAVRTAEYTYDQQVKESLLKVQTTYREIWYLEKAIEFSNRQIELLGQELRHAESLIIPGAGASNIEPQRYKTRIETLIVQRNAEKDGFVSDKNTKLENLRRILNLHPSIQFKFDFEGMDSNQVEDFNIAGLTDTDEMLRIIALTDRRVGEAYGQYEALGHLLWLENRKVNIPEAVLSVFGGHNVGDTFLFNPQDQNGINFLKPTNRYGGALFRGPELIGLIGRIRNGNVDAMDRLRLQRWVVDAAKTAVLEEIRDAKGDLDTKRDALKQAFIRLNGREEANGQPEVKGLRRELEELRTRRAASEADMSDDFAKQREILDAERDLLRKRAEYLSVVRSFQARYLPNTKEELRSNVVTSAAAEAQTLRLGARLLQHNRELVESAITWETRTVPLEQFARGSSLGSETKITGLSFDKQNFASSILSSKLGFLSALFGLVIGAGSRKKAWTQFQNKFDQKLSRLTGAAAPRAGQNSVVSIFAEEGELSNNSEFINQFLKRSVNLEVFVNARDQEGAILKMAKYFPEGALPKNLKVHFYNKRLPIYSVMDKRIAAVAAAGFRPVVVTNESGFFRKLEQAKSVIKVSHEKNYPGELVMEIGRRIGLANGLYDQISGDEKSLIAYDSSRGVFYLRPIEKLINDLFQQVIRDYQIKISA